MSRKRRTTFNPMSLAFLDVMSCGFGAVVLIFLIMDHRSGELPVVNNQGLETEVQLLQQEITEGESSLVRIRNTIADISLEVVTAQGLANRIEQQVQDFLQQLAAMENTTIASDESVEQLRSDIQSLEQEVQRLQASAIEETGTDARAFLGEGDRQYLSGMFLGGNRIMILLDSSASMLDETIVNIIRTRNMSIQDQINAQKWQRAVRTTKWITSQMPLGSQYQIYSFNETTQPVLEETQGQWLEVADRAQLNEAIEVIEKTVPRNGTNLSEVFRAAAAMTPPPDNIYLITDGLPTLSNKTSSNTLVTPEQRVELFNDALDYLPKSAPVNVILLPLEGDPLASALYWELSIATRGSFLSPARDWP